MASSSRLSTPVLLKHDDLRTTFSGVEHHLSTPTTSIAQFRGIRYATIPARFKHSSLLSEYSEQVDCSQYGCVLEVILFCAGADDELGLCVLSQPSSMHRLPLTANLRPKCCPSMNSTA
jgi:hypothetical protein